VSQNSLTKVFQSYRIFIKHFIYQHDAIQDRNITNYQVDLRVANSETLPDLWLPVSEDAEAFEQRYMLHIPDSPESFVNVIGKPAV